MPLLLCVGHVSRQLFFSFAREQVPKLIYVYSSTPLWHLYSGSPRIHSPPGAMRTKMPVTSAPDMGALALICFGRDHQKTIRDQVRCLTQRCVVVDVSFCRSRASGMWYCLAACYVSALTFVRASLWTYEGLAVCAGRGAATMVTHRGSL